MCLAQFFSVVITAVAALASAHTPRLSSSPSETRGNISGPHTINTTTVDVDVAAPGLRFDGHGALSAGGSSRLLIDYEEPYVVST